MNQLPSSEIPVSQAAAPTRTSALVDRIVSAEKDAFSWTLMHRFNLCHELLDGMEDEPHALMFLFVWLRFSAIRQLDWQRCFNTKPQELSVSQDQLTMRLASIYAAHPKARFWIRLLLTTVGRGGEGQGIRDEILNIIHRHNIGQAHWKFLEQWHQKLHNNTTPDDIVICEAYLAFLESGGDLEHFYNTLANGGIDRKRLQSYDRPISIDPEMYWDERDGLINDFKSFLKLLKSLHSSTDLETASAAAWDYVDEPVRQKLNVLFTQRRQNAASIEGAYTIIELRKALSTLLVSVTHGRAIREILYLDLALEQTLRLIIEQQNLAEIVERDLLKLTWLTVTNLCISSESLECYDNSINFNVQEFACCARHLQHLLESSQEDYELWLNARSVTDRLSRAIGFLSEELYRLLQPKAQLLGERLNVETWAIAMFSEEIIRGSSIFMLSLLLHYLEPKLRERAGIGDWQIISLAHATGRVCLADKLSAIQGETFTEPTLLITDVVSGDEEIPKGIMAVITCDMPDLVSHVAVRARNDYKLFATCFNKKIYDRLKGFLGKELALEVIANGDIEYHEVTGKTQQVMEQLARPSVVRRKFSSWVVTPEHFTADRVGNKSCNLFALRNHIPGWIHVPPSIALPFGVFEKSLTESANRRIHQKYNRLVQQLPGNPENVLPEIRQLLLHLHAPKPLQQELLAAWQKQNLPMLEWDQIWQSIKKVWASKWNEAAYYTRITHEINHEDVTMAVLIQPVIESKYAFVIHTSNPLTGNNNEIFAEVVVGMGETLVGNYPGRALSFLYRRNDMSLTLLSYPSKSIELRGSGVIFRSDSNDEDLGDFASAGLYDSVLARAPEPCLLDYSNEKLVWDTDFRRNLLFKIAQIGIEVEGAAHGLAQDIEGVVQNIEGAMLEDQFYVVQTRAQVGLHH